MMCSCGRIVSVTLVQYNVGVFDKYEGSSIAAVADIAKQLGADVISLNELDSCTVRTGKVDQIAEFAAQMGEWDYQYAPAMPFNGGAYGVGIVSDPSLKIVRTDKVALPRGNGYEPRAMAVVEYKDFIMASVHLDLTPESRMGQAEVINDYFDTYYADCMKPIFLAGDFNATPDSELIALMKESWTPISPLNLSYPSHNPDRCIDYIFLRPSGRDVIVDSDFSCPLSPEQAAASDHLPVVVSVKIR